MPSLASPSCRAQAPPSLARECPGCPRWALQTQGAEEGQLQGSVGPRDSQHGQGSAAAGRGHGGQAGVATVQLPTAWAAAGLWAELLGHSRGGGYCQQQGQQEQNAHETHHQVHGEAGLAAVTWDADLSWSCGSSCVTMVLLMSQWSFSCHCSIACVTVVVLQSSQQTAVQAMMSPNDSVSEPQSAESWNGLAWKEP